MCIPSDTFSVYFLPGASCLVWCFPSNHLPVYNARVTTEATDRAEQLRTEAKRCLRDASLTLHPDKAPNIGQQTGGNCCCSRGPGCLGLWPFFWPGNRLSWVFLSLRVFIMGSWVSFKAIYHN
jgi:hypothetical protein